MRIFRGVGHGHPPSAVTIGNFDGVHRGHQALLRLLVERARERDLEAVVVTFEPHPQAFFAPASAPARLMGLREKAAALVNEGVTRLHVLRFNSQLARLEPSDFVERLLVAGLNAHYVVVGDDFRFGAHRRGGIDELYDFGERLGFGVEAMPTVAIADRRASSSAIREALTRGDVALAAQLLGRTLALAGRVRPGARLGRTWGVPTLNLAVPPRRLMPTGVFVGWVSGLAEQPLPAVLHAGVRPTVGTSARMLAEAHVLDWSGDAYGRCVALHFAAKLREEQRFASLEALTQQIRADIAAARTWHHAHPHALKEFGLL